MSPGISAGFFVLLQAVFRRAGGLIYDLLLLSCGIRLLMFQPCLDQILICLIRSLIYYNWDMFRAASDDDIEAYSDTVTCLIRKRIEDIVPTKKSVSTPTKNSGLTLMFDQPCQRGHLLLNPETLTIGNKPVTISGDPSKPPNDNTKTKLKNNSTTTTQEACGRASTTSQALKGINQLL